MRKLLYLVATSIDNFIANKQGNIEDFPREGPHADDYIQQLLEMDTVLIGRNAYEFGYQYGLVPGKALYPHMKHYLYSSSIVLKDLDENLEVINSQVAEHVKELKQSEGGPIFLLGGGILAGFLLKEGLIDEMHRRMCPVVLGGGVPLFGDFEGRPPVKLYDKKTYDNGVILEKYHVVNLSEES